MKKLVRGFAALSLPALLVTSCAQETIESKIEDGNYLNYGIAVGKHSSGTRATETVTADLQNGFTVLVNNGSTLFNTGASGTSAGTYAISYSSGWTFNNGDPVLHPATPLYHYATYPTAIKPASINLDPVVGTEVATPAFTYIATGDEDLVAAAATTSVATTTTASLTFKHLLSQINFAVLGLENYPVKINSILLKGIRNTADYTFSQGAVNAAPNAWNNYSSTRTGYTYSAPASYGVAITDYQNVTKFNNGTNALMLLPQSLSTLTMFEFTYEIFSDTAATKKIDGGTVSVNLGDATAFGASPKWEMGKRYLYTIKFESPKTINYDVVEVSDWDDDPEIEKNANIDNNRDGNGFTPNP